MGSFFAGIKAGTLSGIFYFGGIAAFNALLLYAFRPDVLNLISQSYPQNCPSTHNASACFNLIVGYLPYMAFLGFFMSLFFVGLFGRFYESFPGKSPLIKGEVAAIMVGFALAILGLAGVRVGALATEELAVFFAVWTFLYGAFLGGFYKRYTRTVKFETIDADLVRVLIDGNDYTGVSRTFAHSSTHTAKAKVAKGASFNGWNSSGGVTVESPRSSETTIEVSGDGLLRAQGARKN
jgi:hypothetical protein